MTTARNFVAASLILGLLGVSSCGYFLYPERVGQTEGKVDPTVVILDALGLFVGVIPGVVAFAVDFTTGTIYLPPGEKSAIEKHRNRTSFIDRENLDLSPVPALELPLDPEITAHKISDQLGIDIDPSDIQFYRVNTAGARLAMRPIQ